MNKDPYTNLASALHSTFSKQTKQAVSGVGAVLGTITATGLKLDDFKHELQDYMIAELPGMLALPRYMGTGTTAKLEEPYWDDKQINTSFYMEKTDIEDVRLELNQGLKPGDRVLAVRVNGGNDVVVVCRVVSAGA
ncbi:hypothetical protein OIN60_19865 [Paenibacillus sp. P96]|uniref:DUF2577 domain-containing protein n=1 Tax=Paenibacillus zeirhizosphaerae TaxID=2987519 RepID=A0ABT9FWB5_9BACL|nr:hypothetical protein [Paenibacillus sp. P96]MDP4098985.1 hypothetical protein [Paenibacillus sp. P96]